MKQIILIASLLMAGGLWAEQKICEVTTGDENKLIEEIVLKCKEGDILHMTSMYVHSIKFALRACEYESINSTGSICIYRGSLRDYR